MVARSLQNFISSLMMVWWRVVILRILTDYKKMNNEELERLGQADIKISGLQIWIHGRQFPDLKDSYDDGDWLNIAVHCCQDGASVFMSGSFLRLSELKRWYIKLKAMHKTLSGEANLECIEPELAIAMKAGSLGHVTMEVDITPDNLTQKHWFQFNIDQSYLAEIISQCETIFSIYA